MTLCQKSLCNSRAVPHVILLAYLIKLSISTKSLGNCRVSRLGGRGRGFEVEVEVKKSRSRLKSRGRGFEVEVEVLKSRSRLKSRGRG